MVETQSYVVEMYVVYIEQEQNTLAHVQLFLWYILDYIKYRSKHTDDIIVCIIYKLELIEHVYTLNIHQIYV